MCGIIGILGQQGVTARLIEALKRLEYRGYDSAGVATLVDGLIERRRAHGKIKNLEDVLVQKPLAGLTGIGHTRWATHGAPTTRNAHPHATTRVAVVHNGIIENFRTLRSELEAEGRIFDSETDTEVITQLISLALELGANPKEAVVEALKRVRGAFAIACLFAGENDLLIGARQGSPLVVGVGEGEMYLGSDGIAVAPFTNRVIYLDEGDLVVLTRTSHAIYDAGHQPVTREVKSVAASAAAVEKGNYRHYMQKEIHEEPDAAARTIGHYIDPLEETLALPNCGVDFAVIDQLWIVGCGTAYLAGRVGEYWFEQVAGLACEVDIASEFRYREPVAAGRAAALFISQSGETADTLEALRLCKRKGWKTIAVVNVPESSIAREADAILPTLAGPEIGVASTKAFVAQLSALAAIAVAAARTRQKIDRGEERHLCHLLMETPRLIGEAIKVEAAIAAAAKESSHARSIIYIGRGMSYPIALEAALKLKEISYIHAEGYAAGELKHGPIALIDEVTPVFAIAPYDHLFEKTISNVQEIAARKGRVTLFSDAQGIEEAGDVARHVIEAPKADPFVAPIVYSPLIHLLAYHVALAKGTDVDQPRNLAKSVTVE
ncbi:glutamine--fructose-6-phosphate transaminase (isomerizing) [Candidatus Phycosocius spiralis]|uniref:Glutamine--fructose-6-phosphate aminotransferase [isomerizing] n=1 Tax=Candidatus Phycosocius spiralis TaxID=2815099 RepID=A0ABQ4PVX7_9PROT|nr:glutamine--fructose-6-phosphate transaminase (isomerizing) [Candidatus Phycosocius spiralis]GIU67131.1 glutamine--fructose-6-phosphate aminotransferase [isomerizing] [Candidatus Phycosocius spiralis]